MVVVELGIRIRVIDPNVIGGSVVEVQVSNVSSHTIGSSDNRVAYNLEHVLTGDGSRPTSAHSIVVSRDGGPIKSAIVLAAGGSTGVHAHTVVQRSNSLFVAVGDQLCSLKLPELQLDWNVQVDQATCFGVHYVSHPESLISHGELEISRIGLDGRMFWRTSGADIFSGPLWMENGEILVKDFEERTYRIDVATGEVRGHR